MELYYIVLILRFILFHFCLSYYNNNIKTIPISVDWPMAFAEMTPFQTPL
jgi:hypothetical protein